MFAVCCIFLFTETLRINKIVCSLFAVFLFTKTLRSLKIRCSLFAVFAVLWPSGSKNPLFPVSCFHLGKILLLYFLSPFQRVPVGTGGYQVDNDATMQKKTWRSTGHEGASGELDAQKSWQKWRVFGRRPYWRCFATPRCHILTFRCPKYAIFTATRAKLRAKNGRGVRHRSHLKQFKCAVGFFNDDVRQGTMRALRRLGLWNI